MVASKLKYTKHVAEFISTFSYYADEQSGDKCYTIRDDTHRNFNKLWLATHIRIRRGYTSTSFVRKISHVLFWDKYIIIAWRHSHD